MTGEPDPPSKYNLDIVAQVLLVAVVEQPSVRLTVDELVGRVVGDPDDEREVDTAKDAVLDLRRWGLIRFRNDDELVEPTQAAIRAHELLTAR